MAVKIDHETFLNTTFGSNKEMPVLHGQVWNKHQEWVYNTPVKVNPAPPPNLGKGGDLGKKLKGMSECPHRQGNSFIPMPSLFLAYQWRYMLKFQFLLQSERSKQAAT